MDSFDIFIQQCIDPESASNDMTPFVRIHEKYTNMCKERNIVPLSLLKLSHKLMERYEKVRRNQIEYRGIRLL